MQIVSVRGMKANASGIIYCGRPCRGWKGSPLCNPSRDWGCPEYNAYLREQVRIGNRAILDALLALPADAKLGCWCTNREGPAPDGEEVCHCEIIAKVAVEVQARNTP